MPVCNGATLEVRRISEDIGIGGSRAAATPNRSAADTAGCAEAVSASACSIERRTNW